MIKNRTMQLVFLSAFSSLAILAFIASFGTFEYTFRSDFYVHFTNLSNYFCMIIMFIELKDTIAKQSDSYISSVPIIKFVGLTAIVLTFIVFNFLLASQRDMSQNFQVKSVLLHIVLPIMYIMDWILFYEKQKIRWYAPLLALFVPILYVCFIFVRAYFLNFDASIPYIYPYFFLNLDTLGVVGVAKWIGILVIGFLVIGYLFIFIDKLLATIDNKEQFMKM